MKFEENNLCNCSTSDEIVRYDKVFWEDGDLNEYMVEFSEGCKLTIDKDEITEEELKYLIENEVCIHFNFSMSILKDNFKKKESKKESQDGN